jgi:hypothetical protein
MAKMEFNYISQFAITTAHEGEQKKETTRALRRAPGREVKFMQHENDKREPKAGAEVGELIAKVFRIERGEKSGRKEAKKETRECFSPRLRSKIPK